MWKDNRKACDDFSFTPEPIGSGGQGQQAHWVHLTRDDHAYAAISKPWFVFIGSKK